MKRLILILTLLAAILVAGCGSSGAQDTPKIETPPVTYTPMPPAVIYEITSAKFVSVTMNSPTGGTEQYSTIVVPHKFTYNQFYDRFLYISAQNHDESGSVTVTIYVYGQVFKTSTSSGAYVIATASGFR
jgi:hypothetical protein